MPLHMIESTTIGPVLSDPTLLPCDLAHWKSCLHWLHPCFMVWRSWVRDSETSSHDQCHVGVFKCNHPTIWCYTAWDTMLCRTYCGHCRAVARYGQQKVRPWLHLWHSIRLIECWWLRPTMNYISGTGVNQFHSQSVTPQIKGRKLGNLLFTELKHELLIRYWVYMSLELIPLEFHLFRPFFPNWKCFWEYYVIHLLQNAWNMTKKVCSLYVSAQSSNKIKVLNIYNEIYISNIANLSSSSALTAATCTDTERPQVSH